MTNRFAPYLYRNRCDMLGFRIVIPTDLRLFFPAREYRLTLNISALSEANRTRYGKDFEMLVLLNVIRLLDFEITHSPKYKK